MKLLHGNNLELLATLPDNSVDSIVTDPPYGLGKEPDALAMLRDWLDTGHHDVKSKRGFMGKEWDNFVPQPAQWKECLRVLKPGGHVLAFAGTRTQDLMALGLRIAGFEIRDLVAWIYGSGFPKVKTVLKPALEPITLARKPGKGGLNIDDCRIEIDPAIDDPRLGGKGTWSTEKMAKNIYEGGFAGIRTGSSPLGRWPANVIHDGSNEVLALFPDTGKGESKPRTLRRLKATTGWSGGSQETHDAGTVHCDSGGSAARFFKTCEYEEIELFLCRAKDILEAWKPNLAGSAESSSNPSNPHDFSVLRDAVTVVSLGAKQLSDVRGLSTAVTESEFETICETLMAVTLSLGNALSPVQWPDAPIPNGCLARLVETQSLTGTTTITISLPTSDGFAEAVIFSITPASMGHGEKDSKSSRFTYCAKTNSTDRNEGCEALPDKDWSGDGAAVPERANRPFNPSKNNHPTVKPTALMRYLCRLVTPPGGTILDPWMGSGSTGKAAKLEGFDFIGMEREAEYFKIAQARCGVEVFSEEDFWG